MTCDLSDPRLRWNVKTGIVLDVLQRYGIVPYGRAGLDLGDALAEVMLAALDAELAKGPRP